MTLCIRAALVALLALMPQLLAAQGLDLEQFRQGQPDRTPRAETSPPPDQPAQPVAPRAADSAVMFPANRDALLRFGRNELARHGDRVARADPVCAVMARLAGKGAIAVPPICAKETGND